MIELQNSVMDVDLLSMNELQNRIFVKFTFENYNLSFDCVVELWLGNGLGNNVKMVIELLSFERITSECREYCEMITGEFGYCREVRSDSREIDARGFDCGADSGSCVSLDRKCRR